MMAWRFFLYGGLLGLMLASLSLYAVAQQPTPAACPAQLAQMSEYADSLAREGLASKHALAGVRVQLRALCALVTLPPGAPCTVAAIGQAIAAQQAALAAQAAKEGASLMPETPTEK